MDSLAAHLQKPEMHEALEDRFERLQLLEQDACRSSAVFARQQHATQQGSLYQSLHCLWQLTE